MESTYSTSSRFKGLSADGETPGRKAPPTHISGAAAMWLAIGSSIPPRDPQAALERPAPPVLSFVLARSSLRALFSTRLTGASSAPVTAESTHESPTVRRPVRFAALVNSY